MHKFQKQDFKSPERYLTVSFVSYFLVGGKLK